MKRLIGLTTGFIMMAFLVATVNAAPQETTEAPKPKQGITNAKKSAQNQLEQNKKANENFKKGNAKRQQAQSAAQ